MKRCDVVIIGGGLTGLSAAYHLSKRGRDVILVEKDMEVGGLVSSWDLEGYKIEKFYHHISKNDVFLVDLLEDLGIKEKLKWKHGSVGYYYENNVYKMDTPLDILRFKGLNFIDMIRIAFIVLWVKLKKDYSDLDEISARDWLIEKSGERGYNNFFRPLLKGKFGKNLKDVSAAWLFGRIKFRSRRSISGEKLGYMDHGFSEFIERLYIEIENNGGKIFKDTTIKEIKAEDGRVSGVSTTSGEIIATNVISTIPPKELLKICSFPTKFGDMLKKIKYQRTICALLGLETNLLEKVYWLNIKSETLPFGAIIEHTNFHNIPGYGRDHLVYVVSYVQEDKDELWEKKDEDIISDFVKGLEQAFPGFSKSSVKWWRLARGIYSAPIYRKGYLKDIREIRSPIKGLYITGMFMTYPERSMNGSLELGKEMAFRLDNED
ncbi:MAG: NAD(P)/FAD-dependent oxidoreductase [Candidatus Hydrothermarchaeales archaeon]